MLIPEHIWAQMTEAEQQLVRETIKGNRMRGKVIQCPHCNGSVHVSVSCDINAIDADARADQNLYSQKLNPLEMLSMSERRIVEVAQANGMMSAFEQAVREEKKASGVPSNMLLFFLQFWELMRVVEIDRKLRGTWAHEFGGVIQVFEHISIYCVTSDGVVVAFVPASLTKPQKRKHGAALDTSQQFELWRKGKFGYVPAEARGFGDALRQANIGKFGQLVQ